MTKVKFSQMKKGIISGDGVGSNSSDPIQVLARKKIWVVVLWSLLFPLGTYVYTRRWKPFFTLLGCLMLLGGVIGMLSEDETAAFDNGFLVGSFITPVVAGIDNGTEIVKARKKTGSR